MASALCGAHAEAPPARSAQSESVALPETHDNIRGPAYYH